MATHPKDASTRLDRRLRARDLDDLPHEWDTRYELIGGTLFMSRRPPFEHQAFLTRLLVRVHPAAAARGGVAVQEPGLVWDDDGDDNVSPDLVVLIDTPAPPRGEKLRTCPEIVVEALSQGDENRRRDLVDKRELYLRRGAREYWIADVEQREILVLRRSGEQWAEARLRGNDLLHTPLLPGWEVRVGELFSD